MLLEKSFQFFIFCHTTPDRPVNLNYEISWKNPTHPNYHLYEIYVKYFYEEDFMIWAFRNYLLELNEKGLPCATEALDPNSPQYYQDLISWSAIGARTTESQTHREMSSGLSSPVGFKNGTDGGLTVATNAMQSVKYGHSFLGLNEDGQVSIINTNGNPYAHVVLRGGNGKPNYDAGSVAEAENALAKAKVSNKIMIDTSHANSNKDPYLQPLVLKNITEQILDGNKSIVGIMVESHLKGGRQDLTADLSQLEYGKSITDGCIDWDTTVKAMHDLRDAIKDVLPTRELNE